MKMDRETFYNQNRAKFVKVLKNKFVLAKKEISMEEIEFEDLWEDIARTKFTGYMNTIASDYRWHAIVIEGNIRFSGFYTRTVNLFGKEALLSLKSKWNKPALQLNLFATRGEPLLSYHAIFNGSKEFDGINPDTIGINRVFEKLEQMNFTGTMILDIRKNKYMVLWFKGQMQYIFPANDITKKIKEEELKEALLLPTLNITAIKSHAFGVKIPAEKLLYVKRSKEFNELISCVQEQIKQIIGSRVARIIAQEVRKNLIAHHSFYEKITEIEEEKLLLNIERIEQGFIGDLDNVIKEILAFIIARGKKDLPIGLLKKILKECESREVEEKEEEESEEAQ